MAERIFTASGLTSGTGTANNTPLTTSAYLAVKGGSATQIVNFNEIMITGLAIVTSPALFIMQRASVIETAPTALAAPSSDGPRNPYTAALAAPPVTFIAANTQPTSSNVVTDAKLNLGLNLFGGIMRWVAREGRGWMQIGNTATLGESLLNAFTGTTSGAFSASITYEPE